jgi:hypothetical protein
MVVHRFAPVSRSFAAAVLGILGMTALLQVAMESPSAATGNIVITTQPVSQSVSLGDTATFTAAARGYPAPTVEWQVSVDGGSSWIEVTGLNTPTISGVPTLFLNGWQFRAEFINAGGFAITRAVTLTVHAPDPSTDHGYPSGRHGRRGRHGYPDHGDHRGHDTYRSGPGVDGRW